MLKGIISNMLLLFFRYFLNLSLKTWTFLVVFNWLADIRFDTTDIIVGQLIILLLILVHSELRWLI